MTKLPDYASLDFDAPATGGTNPSRSEWRALAGERGIAASSLAAIVSECDPGKPLHVLDTPSLAYACARDAAEREHCSRQTGMHVCLLGNDLNQSIQHLPKNVV